MLRRARLGALLPLWALAACAAPATEDCPGATLVQLALHGVRDDGATGCDVAPPGGWLVPATLPDAAPTAATPVPTFLASFRQLGGDELAYCTGEGRAAVLHGTRSGDHLRVEVTLPGAVLGACAATCRPLMREVIEGDLVAGQGGAAATFTGTLTETFEDGQGPCGECRLPCRSTYALTGTAQPPGS